MAKTKTTGAAKTKPKAKPIPKAKTKPKPTDPDAIPKGKIQDFPIEMLKFSHHLQPRVNGDAKRGELGYPVTEYHVLDIMEADKRGEALPPIQVWCVAGMGNFVTDGHHVTEARHRRGHKTVRAEVHEGTWFDARKAAARANSEHKALKLTNADKRNQVSELLAALAEAKENWSNGRVAKWCGVSDDLVATMKMRQPVPSAPAGPVKGADGKEYDAGKASESGKKGAEAKKEKGKGKADVDADGFPLSYDDPPSPLKPADAPKPPAYDLRRFDERYGPLEREIDVLAGTFPAHNPTRVEGVRRLLREFDTAFRELAAELVKAKSKEKS